MAKQNAYLSPARKGKKQLSAWIPVDVVRDIKIMAAYENSSNQALVEEAINLLFESRGKPAPIKRDKDD